MLGLDTVLEGKRGPVYSIGVTRSEERLLWFGELTRRSLAGFSGQWTSFAFIIDKIAYPRGLFIFLFYP